MQWKRSRMLDHPGHNAIRGRSVWEIRYGCQAVLQAQRDVPGEADAAARGWAQHQPGGEAEQRLLNAPVPRLLSHRTAPRRSVWSP